MCNATVIQPGECNPLHGWWKNESKGAGLLASWLGIASGVQDCPYAFIDTTTTPPEIKKFTMGELSAPREPTSVDGVTNVLPNSRTGPSEIVENGRVFYIPDTFFPGLFFNRGISITLQEDGVTAIVDSSGRNTLPQGGGVLGFFSILKKLDGPPPFPIRPASSDGGFPNVNNPVYMFNQAVDIWTKSQNTQTASDLPNPFIGANEAEAVREQLLLDGIVRTSGLSEDGNKVTKILTSVPFPDRPLSTTFIFEKFPDFNRGSTITVEGFNAPYDVLNGNHDVFAWDSFYYQPDSQYVKTSTSQFRVVIGVDTQGLPSYNEAIHGQPIIRTKYGPIRSNSTYRQVIAALTEWNTVCIGGAIHEVLGVYCYIEEPNVVIETFEELADRLADGTAVQFIVPQREGQIQGSYFYAEPPITFNPDIPTGPFPARDQNVAPWNDPFSIGAPGWVGLDFITVDNYIEDKKYLWWRINPNTPINYPINAVIAIFYGNAGSRFEGFVSNDIPSSGVGPVPNSFPYGTNDFSFYFSIVKPEFSDGKKIGYVHLGDTGQGDPILLDTDPRFGEEGSPIQQIQGRIDIWAAMMRYFVTEEQVDDIIFDIRSNNGGKVLTALASLIGGDRDSILAANTFNDNDQRPTVKLENLTQTYTGLPSDPKAIQGPIFMKSLLPSVVETIHPDAVFKNGKIIVLTSTSSQSGGDVFPQLFQGNGLDGNVGNGVQATVMGEIDGRLYGISNISRPMAMSETNSKFRDTNRQLVSPFIVRGESIGTLFIGDVWTGDRNAVPYLTPYPHPFSNNLEDTVYPDYGYVAPVIPPLPGDPRPPADQNDPTTWKDSWLEQSLRFIRGLPIVM